MPAVDGDIVAALQNAWQAILDFLAPLLSPDWGALVALIPLLVLPLVLLYLLAASGAWTVYGLARPRPRVRYEEGARPLPRGPDGRPEPPAGLPFSLRAGFVYPPGTARSPEGDDLSVICPMCRVERPAELPTCGNCGLVLRVDPGIRVSRPAGPPPGGATIA